MKQLLKRFDMPLDDNSINQKIRVEPSPLLDIGSLSVEAACKRIDHTLTKVFIPTKQVNDLLRQFIAISHEHILTFYPDEATYIRNCYQRDLTRSEPWFPIGLSGPAGVGKSELLKALVRLLDDTGDTINISGLPDYPIQSVWMMTMRSGGSLSQLLQPFRDPEGSIKAAQDLSAIRISAAKRAYTFGVALNVVDEFQFITSTQSAHAKAAIVLMQLSLIGPPLVFCVNYSMINKLMKRPQQERQRLLSNIKFLYPDFANSADWFNTLAGQFNVVPEAFSSDLAINPAHDGDAIHRYSFGIRRLSAKLLSIGYRHARERGSNVVSLADIESAYKSSIFTSQRQDVELLIQQNIERKCYVLH